MQNNLPAPLNNGAYALDPQSTTEVIPAQYPMSMDDYSTVCVHVRESQVIASKQPAIINCNHNHYQAGGSGAHGFVPPGATFGKRAPRRNNIIGWVCMGQLAIIIGLIGFQNWHLDKASLERLQVTGTALTSGSALRSLFNNYSVVVPNSLSSLLDELQNTQFVGEKNKSKSKGNKSASHGKAHGWNIVKNFIPPPPPGFALPKSGLLVPPPPVTYPLTSNSTGAGAVGASTLPPARPMFSTEQVKGPTVAPTVIKHTENVLPAEPLTIGSASTDNAVGTAAATNKSQIEKSPIEDPGPEWFAPPPGPEAAMTESRPAAISMPAYEYRTTSEHRPTRTVLAGRRVRIIADR